MGVVLVGKHMIRHNSELAKELLGKVVEASDYSDFRDSITGTLNGYYNDVDGEAFIIDRDINRSYIRKAT